MDAKSVESFVDPSTADELSEDKFCRPEFVDSSDVQLTEGDGLSKKGRKRLLKQKFREDAKKVKKLKDREKRKGTNSRSFRMPSISTVEHTEMGSTVEISTTSRKERKQSEKVEYAGLCLKNFTVIIDLNWEEQHTEKALKSLKQQVMYCYGFNKRHTNPAYIHLTGLGPLLTQQLVTQNCADNWVGMKLDQEEYITMENYSIAYDDDVKAGLKKQLVYLSSDADETLETVDTNCAYIIGGIVDRNRLKGITHKKAVAQGLRTAKLPIKENYALAATHILTVNHVFEILLNFGPSGGWRKAMEAVLPQRKHAKALNGDDQHQGDIHEQEDTYDGDDKSDLELGREDNDSANKKIKRDETDVVVADVAAPSTPVQLDDVICHDALSVLPPI